MLKALRWFRTALRVAEVVIPLATKETTRRGKRARKALEAARAVESGLPTPERRP